MSSIYLSPATGLNPNGKPTNSSIVKNLQVLADEETHIPTVERSSHPDLKRISSQTLATILNRSTNNLLIIDARYPFEYAGGHIDSSVNIYTEYDLQLLFKKLASSLCRPSLIIFHCEFSSERAPRLCRLFRSLDREHNIMHYPHLSFPSLYLLDGGYANFFQHSFCKQFCHPQSYVSMFEQQYTQELKIYCHAKKIANGRIITQNLIERLDPIQLCLS